MVWFYEEGAANDYERGGSVDDTYNCSYDDDEDGSGRAIATSGKLLTLVGAVACLGRAKCRRSRCDVHQVFPIPRQLVLSHIAHTFVVASVVASHTDDRQPHGAHWQAYGTPEMPA